MAGIGYWRGAGLCGLAVFSFSAPVQAQLSGGLGQKWGSHIDAEARLGSKRDLGEADLFMPIRQDEDTLVFTDLRGRFDSQSGNEGNFGVGMRRMLPSGWNFGAYGYYDHRRTGLGSVFDQGTLGVEALGRDWDFRVNGYIPLGSRVQSLGSVSAAAISGAAVQITTTAREERALGGYDAEMGWRVPLFDVENSKQLRLYGGGYWFGDDVLKVTGSRLRAEFALAQVQGLWKGAELSLGAEAQKDDARGGQTFLGIRLRIPFGGGSERSRQLTWQERRMTAPLVRDVDIVSQSRIASTLVETATTTGGQAITALNSGTTTGAALPGAITAAGANSTVILSGTFNTTATTTLQAGQTVMGGGALTVRGASGRTATLSLPTATVSATIGVGSGAAATNPAFMLANNSTLTGLTIGLSRSGGAGAYAVFANGISGATISNSTISATESGNNPGIGLVLQNSTNMTVSGNSISGTTGAGATATGLALVSALGNTSATVTGNTLSASGGSANNYAAFVNGTAATLTINAGSTGNIRASGTCYNGLTATGSLSFTDLTTCP